MKAFVWHETDSVLHRLNPLTKLALNVPVVMIVSTATEPLLPAVVAGCALLATRWLGRVPWPSLLRPLAFAAILAVGIFWTGSLFYAGAGSLANTPSDRIGLLPVTTAGLQYGATMAARLLAIFSTSMLFVLTTDPAIFVLALIQQARLPDRIGYGIFAAYRFVPLLQTEFENIRAAHQMRGGDDASRITGRIKRLAGYLIPLLAIAVRKGEQVSLAMETRAFGAVSPRTYFRTTRLGWNDAIFAAAAAVVLGMMALLM